MYICTFSVTCVKCGIRSTLCWKIGNISGSTELFGLEGAISVYAKVEKAPFQFTLSVEIKWEIPFSSSILHK